MWSISSSKISIPVGKTVLAYWPHELSPNFFLSKQAERVWYVGLNFVFVFIILNLLVRAEVDWDTNQIGSSVWGILLGGCWFYYRWQSWRRGRVLVHDETVNTKFVPDKKRKQVNVYDCMTSDSQSILRRSYRYFYGQGEQLNGRQLAIAIFKSKSTVMFVRRLGADRQQLVSRLIKANEKTIASNNNVPLMLVSAYRLAFELEVRQLTPAIILMAIIEHDALVRELLFEVGIDAEMVGNVALWLQHDDNIARQARRLRKFKTFYPTNRLDKAMLGIETKVLNYFGVDMTERAAFGYYYTPVPRDDVFASLFEVLTNGNSAILVGEPGVGRKRILEMLAQSIVVDDVPNNIRDKRLINVAIGELIGGADTATIIARLQQLFNEAAQSGNIILCFEDVHGLAGIHAGGGQSVDVATILASLIKNSRIMVVATTAPTPYRSLIYGTELGEHLQVVNVPEPDINMAIRMAETRAHIVEAKYKVLFTYGAIHSLVALTARYIPDRFLPRKATEHLDRLAYAVSAEDEKSTMVESHHVESYLEQILHLPLQNSSTREADLLLNLESVLHQDIVGQNEAVTAVAEALRRTRAGVRNEDRPIAVLLFLGPTGVGKTALAKTLAKHYFGNQNNMTRLDMSEYQTAQSVDQLLTPSDYGLVANIKRRPFQILLLDEFEKADKHVRDLFLQVFEDGRLTDSNARTADFTHTIIIATSNAGADKIQEAAARGVTNQELDLIITDEVLRQNFSPELLNRFDDVVIFHPLSVFDVELICGLLLNEIKARLATKGIGFEVEAAAVKALAEAGYDPRFGARPLRRALQHSVEEMIAKAILGGELVRRDTIVIKSPHDYSVIKGEAL